MSEISLIIIAVLSGSFIALQPALNAKLATFLHHPLQAALISFLVGFVTLSAIHIVMRLPFPTTKLQDIPARYFLGGALGAAFVTSVTFLIPRLGAASVIAATVAGQFITALVIDHMGLLGVPVHPISWLRALGVLLLFAGVYLIRTF